MKFRITNTPGARPGDAPGTRVIVTPHAGKIVAGIFALVFLIFAGVGWVMMSSAGADARLMEAGAVEVMARVEKLEVQRRRSQTSNGTRTTYFYTVGLTYTDPAGTPLRAQLSISEADYNRLQVGHTVPLRHAAADPAVVELRAGDLAGSAQVGKWIMLAGVFGVGVTVLATAIAGRRKANVV